MSSTAALDAALIAQLRRDPLFATDVYWGVAPPGTFARFVIIDQLAHLEDQVSPASTVWERITYLVKVVTPGPDIAAALAAADRLHTLLDGRTDIAVDEYLIRVLRRVHRVRFTEFDNASDLRFQHVGGHYEVIVAPVAVTVTP